jgi:hypothetical protein
MALVLRRTTHVGLEIRGWTVAQWKRRQQKKMEAKGRLDRAYSCSSQSSSEEVVRFSASERRGEGTVTIAGNSGSGERDRRTVLVDITP